MLVNSNTKQMREKIKSYGKEVKERTSQTTVDSIKTSITGAVIALAFSMSTALAAEGGNSLQYNEALCDNQLVQMVTNGFEILFVFVPIGSLLVLFGALGAMGFARKSEAKKRYKGYALQAFFYGIVLTLGGGAVVDLIQQFTGFDIPCFDALPF